MKRFPIIALSLFVIFAIATSCKDDEPSGPAGALGKSFNLAIDKVTSSLAYSLLVSSDGSRIVASMTYNNSELYYSSDGGTTFNRIGENMFIPRFVAIDNQGNILTEDKQIFKDGAIAGSVSSFDELILGDNGKIFSYNQNYGIIKVRNVASGEFTEVTKPFTPTPGSGGSLYYVSKAPGKGLLFIDVSGELASRTVKAYLLDEGTMEWTDATLTFNSNTINGCNNLNRFERFSYAGNNIVTVKGCTTTALLDLSDSNTTYINFPDDGNLIETDLRDNPVYVDSKKNLYIVAGSYDDLSTKSPYKYDGTGWTKLEGSVATATPLFAADQAGNIYFNTSEGAGESLKGTVKFNINDSKKTALGLPTTKLNITDATGTGDDHLMIIVDGLLYDYDLSAHTASKAGLDGVLHINVLSDGRFLAGGGDHVYISSDNGKNWTETKNIFSSLDATKGGASVTRSRIINGKIVMTGVYQYYYDNLSLGIRQTKYDDIVIEFDGGVSGKLPYQFPGDFLPSAIGPDGVLYGSALFVNEFGTITDRYELKQNTTPERLEGKGLSPQIVTDDGLQLTITPAQSGGAFEIVSRSSATDEWTSTGTTLPGSFTGVAQLRQSGDKLVYLHETEVYISAN